MGRIPCDDMARERVLNMKSSRNSGPMAWHLPPSKYRTNNALVMTSVSIVLQEGGFTIHWCRVVY